MSDVEKRDRPMAGARRRFPLGLVGMLGLVVAVEASIARLERRIEPLDAVDWRQMRQAAGAEAPGSDILCFGDSLVKTGVLPSILEDRLGLRAYNLALLGAPPPGSYFLLRRALDAGATPRAIVLDASPMILMFSDIRMFIRQWTQLLGPLDALQLARAEGDPGMMGPYLAHRAVPSVRLRHDLRKLVVDELAARQPDPPFSWTDIYGRQQAANRGAFVRARNPGGRPDPNPGGEIAMPERHYMYPGWWWAKYSNLVYLEKFLVLAESRGIPVFFLLPPIHPGVQAERERRGLDALYMKLIRDIRDRHRNLVVVDGRHAGYGQEVFCDALHVDCHGAASLTRGLAEVMSASLAGRGDASRWAGLPGFTGGAPEGIEDEVQSRLTLAGGGALLR